jgi:hypothetical protein
MKSIHFAVIAAVIFSASCKTTAPQDGGDGSGGVVSAIVDCADAKTHDTAVSILVKVGTDLIAQDWAALLDGEVVKYGLAAVVCAAREIGGRSYHEAQATGDKLAATKAARARQWLTMHGATP